jgi:hypothetical protein
VWPGFPQHQQATAYLPLKARRVMLIQAVTWQQAGETRTVTFNALISRCQVMLLQLPLLMGTGLNTLQVGQGLTS